MLFLEAGLQILEVYRDAGLGASSQKSQEKMSKGKPIALAYRSFATQKECLAYFQALRRRTAPGTAVGAFDQSDLMALLQRHPDSFPLTRSD